MAATKSEFESLTGGRIIEGYSLTEGMMACLVNPLKGRAKLGSIGCRCPTLTRASSTPRRASASCARRGRRARDRRTAVDEGVLA